MPLTTQLEAPLPVKLTLEQDISRQMMLMVQAADQEGNEKLANALLVAASAIGLGQFEDLANLARMPDMPEEIAKLPIKSIHELEADYRDFTKKSESKRFSFQRWLPTLGVRPLVPGELAVLLADTGVGKTAWLSNLAIHAAPLAVLMFQLELPGTILFERYVQMQTKMDGEAVFNSYRAEETVNYRDKELVHIWTCDRSGLSPADIEKIIEKAHGKMAAHPALVIVDYIGLVRGKGAKRYERISEAAEEMKIIAKKTDTIIVMGSQVARPEDREQVVEPRLHHAKDSGSIENSAGLVLGAWRDETDHRKLWLKILKNTKGRSGKKIPCLFDVEHMTIHELARHVED